MCSAMQVAVQPAAPLQVAQLACWLDAPLAPWGRRFWADAQHTAPANAQDQLRSAPDHLRDAIVSAHPVISNETLSLNSKILLLPGGLHAAACQAARAVSAQLAGHAEPEVDI
jgi:hypothetical protein